MNSRLKEIVKAVRWMAKRSVKAGAEYFIVAGDFFHSRRSIEISVLHAAADLVDFLSGKFEKVVVLIGNHDLSMTGGTHNSVRALRRKNVVVVDKPTVLDLGEKIGFLPWETKPTEVRKAFREFSQQNAAGVVCHLALDKALSGPSDFEVPGVIKLSDLSKGRHRWVLMGHYHKTQSWKKNEKLIAYVGSPLQHNWGERGEKKGFWLVEKGKRPRFVENDKSPRFVLVETKEDAEAVRPQDYVKVVRKGARKHLTDKNENVIIVPEQRDDEIKVRLPDRAKGDRELIRAYLKYAKVPERLNPKYVEDIGNLLLEQI